MREVLGGWVVPKLFYGCTDRTCAPYLYTDLRWSKRLWMLALVSVGIIGCGSNEANVSQPSQDELMQGIVTSGAPETSESRIANQRKLEENLQQARAATASGELDKAIDLLEASLSLDAKHRDVLLLLVQNSQARSKSVLKDDAWRSYRLIVQAGGYMRILRDTYPELSDTEKQVLTSVLFDEACAHARSKRREEFASSLSAAMASGFNDTERLNSDPDLDEFRQVPEMAALIKSAIDSLKR